ncbi:TIGR03943 family putative permease subunit [Halobacillus seohaensis]|uniref:TIGR03943 family putative permease subunit n=1 Tax=Halobacillus seohaensis TaxID=447421 RepID=A0ABW2ENA6_9BACI
MTKDSHSFIRSVILLGFGLFIIKLLISGDIQKFIAPRMMPYMYFALCVIAILAMIQFFKSDPSDGEHSCDCGHNSEYSSSKGRSLLIYLLFIVPIFSGMLFSDHVLGSSQAAKKGFKYELRSTSTDDEFNKANAEDTDELLNDPAIITTKERYPQLHSTLKKSNTLLLNEDNYIGAISLMEDQINDYVGKEIKVKGFVFREGSFPEDRIVVGRFGISCCVADGGIYGLLIQANGQDFTNYKDDTWVEVTGEVKKIQHNNWELPMIEPTKIKKIDVPDEPYVYEEFEFAG